MFCYHCGKENDASAAFCVYCGQRLSAAPPEAPEQTPAPDPGQAAVQPPVQVPVQMPIQPPVQAPVQPAYYQTSTMNRKIENAPAPSGNSTLSITQRLLAAAVFIMGILNFVALIVVAGYILIFEKSAWLKKTSIKAVFIVVVCSLIPVVMGFGDNIFAVLNAIVSWFTRYTFTGIFWPIGLETIVNNAADAIEKLLLVVSAFLALRDKGFKVGFIDRFVDRHLVRE